LRTGEQKLGGFKNESGPLPGLRDYKLMGPFLKIVDF